MQYVLFLIAEPIFEKHLPTVIVSKMDSATKGNDSPSKRREMAESEEVEPLTPEGGSDSPKTSSTHFQQGTNHNVKFKVINWSLWTSLLL